MGRKRKQPEQSDGEPIVKEKRSERGRTRLKIAAKALKEGKPLDLEWSKKHKLPAGKYRSNFSSWIGVTSRTFVSCNVRKWGDVDMPTMERMMHNVTGAFKVPEERHDWCRQKLCELWRKWKSKLVSEFLYDETGAVQTTPPDLYPFITKDDWSEFVEYHTSDEFKATSEKNKKNAANKKSGYCGGRTGYLGIENLIKKDLAEKGIQVENVDRYLTWLRGHTSKKGDMNEYDKEIASTIEEVKRDVEIGAFVPTGRIDILGKAIGKPEHPGRVRGVPQSITITQYFGKAPKYPTRGELIDEINSMKVMMMRFMLTGEKPTPAEIEKFMKVSPSQSIRTIEEPPHEEPRHVEPLYGKPHREEPLFVSG